MKVITDSDTKNDILCRLAKGETSTSIAADYDISSSAVRQFKQKYRDQIIEEAEKYLQTLPDITEMTKQDILTAKKLSKYISDPTNNTNDTALQEVEDILTFKSQLYKTTNEIMKSLGFHTSQSPSFIFQQFNNNNTKSVVVEASIVDLIRKTTENMLDLPETEAPVEEIADNIT